MRWSLRNACCSGGGPRQPWSSRLAPVSRFHFSVPVFPLVRGSLIGLLASVDAKQQKLTFLFFFFFFFLTGGTYARDVVYADRRDTTDLDPADHMGLNRPETEPNSVTG